MPAQSEMLNVATSHEITSSSTPREVSHDELLTNVGVEQEEGKIQASPYHRLEVAQKHVGLKHASLTITASNLCQQQAASAGSVGHPHFCAQACRYVSRKSGCRNSKQCANCHLCQWQRKTMALQPHATVDQHPGEVTSHGILEKTSPREPMKIDLLQRANVYLETATKSHSGAHIRPWLHDENHAVLKMQQPWCPDQESISRPDCCPSVGSLNHPHSCGPPCKYAWKNKGCKDGYLCTRCHLCKWKEHKHQQSRALCTLVIRLHL